MADAPQTYAIALGSNRGFGRWHDPRALLAVAFARIAEEVAVIATAPIVASSPVGPSRRRYANGAALIATPLAPPALLALLKAIEAEFGRRRGRRWGSRPLDLDIALWSGGRWRSGGSLTPLTIPHAAIAERRFVLDPLRAIAPDWPLPRTALRVRHLRARLTRPHARA